MLVQALVQANENKDKIIETLKRENKNKDEKIKEMKTREKKIALFLLANYNNFNKLE